MEKLNKDTPGRFENNNMKIISTFSEILFVENCR
jgi:hypothetical protein